MKRLLLIVLATIALTAHAQTTSRPGWYGYPEQRKVSAVVGGLTGALSYSIIRSAAPHDPKWKSILVSTIFTTAVSGVMYTVYNISPVDSRQNFTASLGSGLAVTFIFSLGI